MTRCEFMFRLRVWPFAQRCEQPSTHELLKNVDKPKERILLCDNHAREARWHITDSNVVIRPLAGTSSS